MEMNYIVTDAIYRAAYIDYIGKNVFDTVKGLGGSIETKEKDDRAAIKISLPDECAKFFRSTLEGAITDVIVIGYKWEYFQKTVRTAGLNDEEYEHLLCALIAADYNEDFSYAARRVQGDPYSIDGCFNFTLKPLVEKWAEVAGCIPPSFAPGQLKDFISYLVNERKGRKIYISDKGVFDARFVRLKKSRLTGEYDVTKEVILSCAGEIELDAPLGEKNENYLKNYYGEKIFFGKGYFG